MVQLSANRCSCIVAILLVSLVSFAAITLCVYYCCCLFHYRLSPETFGYSLVYLHFVVLSFIGRDLVMGRSPIQGFPSNVSKDSLFQSYYSKWKRPKDVIREN
jgi:hypothetical protein